MERSLRRLGDRDRYAVGESVGEIMRPTTLQRIVADYRFPAVCVLLATLTFSGWTIASLDLSPSSFANPWIALSVAGIFLLSFLSGWFICVLFGWPLIGMFLMSRGERNGGPFNVGDRVQIISGKFAGTITTVYSKNTMPDYNRVALGPDAQEKYLDIYSDYQLLRLPQASSNESAGNTA